MSTKKKIVQVILEDDYAEKFIYLSKRDKRSASNLGAMMIENYIDDYEKIHGEIKVD